MFVINRYLLLLLFLFSSCGQTFNSNSNDANLFASSCTEAGTPAGDRYCAAELILQNRCISCHSKYHNSWANYKNDEDWKGSGLVVAGSTSTSDVITYLRNQGGTMPKENPQIPDSEYQTLIDWVQQMP